MAVHQSVRCRLTHRYREQAPSHLLICVCQGWLSKQLIIDHTTAPQAPHKTTVGGGVLPIAVHQSVRSRLTYRGLPSRWLMAVLSFIGRTGLCIRVCPNSRICCFSSLL